MSSLAGGMGSSSNRRSPRADDPCVLHELITISEAGPLRPREAADRPASPWRTAQSALEGASASARELSA